MTNELLRSEETTVVAVYASRHDAEVARSFLDTHSITAFVTADDVHVPLQVTEGARVHVLAREADAARRSLDEAGLGPEDETPSASPEETRGRMIAVGAAVVLALVVFAVLAALFIG